MVAVMPDRITVRLEDHQLAQLDALAEELSAAARGVKLTRSDAVRVVLEHGFAALKTDKKKR